MLALDPAAATSLPPACYCLWDKVCKSVDVPYSKEVSQTTGNPKEIQLHSASLKNRIDASTLRPHEPLTRASPNTESILGRGNPPFTAQQLVLAETHTCYARDTSLTCTSIDKCLPCCRTGNKAAHWRMERTKGRRNRSTCECHLSNRWTCPQACPLHSS